MAVKIRLTRFGRKKKPFYRVVVTDSRTPRDGQYIECIGTYNPLIDPVVLTLQETRIDYWLDRGAQPSDTVRNLFKSKGIMLRRNLKKRGLEEAGIEGEMKKWEALQAERLRRKTEKGPQKKSKKKTAKEKPAPQAAPQAETPAKPEGASQPAG